MNDLIHMHHALTLAARALGRVAPNPAVGCVIVSSDGRIVGRGMTQDGGRPHAETVALAQAREAAHGATAYVTLEPCAHLGNTPPCAHALVAAGVGRVVVAITDPDARVNGKGIAILRNAAIEVTTRVLEREAEVLNQGFFLRIRDDRPLVKIKIAQSADGKTATAPGTDPWITGEEARRFGHLLRAKHDGILVGIETVVADDPDLTCRLPGLEKYSPVRIVLDSALRLSPNARIVQTAKIVPTIVFTTVLEGGETLTEQGVEIIRCEPNTDGRLDLRNVLRVLAERGMTRVLVEGGATVANAFARAGFADRLEIFTAPLVLGDRGCGGIDVMPPGKAAEAPRFVRVSERSFGQDRLESYVATP